VRLLLLLGLLLVSLMGPPAQAQRCARGTLIAEVTHVRDGDTIEVGGLPIRLQGLAAPEGDEPGGDQATLAMRRMELGRELRCELDGERTHDRCVGICGSATSMAWTSAKSWFAVAWHGTAQGSAVGAMPRPNVKLLPKARRSTGPTLCRGIAARAKLIVRSGLPGREGGLPGACPL